MKRLVRLGATTLLVAALVATGRATTADAAVDATLTLTAQPYAIAPGASWRASFDVVGDLGAAASSTAPPTSATPSTAATPSAPSTPSSSRPTVEARVQAHRVLDERADLQAALEGDVPPAVSRLVVPVTLIGTAQQASFDVTVPTTNDPDTPDALALGRPGLYPVTVDLLVDGELAASHLTFVERLPLDEDTDPPLQIAVLAVVDDPGPRADAAAVAATRGDIDAVATAAAAVGGVISVQLPPTIVDQLSGAELDAVRTGLAGAEVLATPALPLDPSSAVAANQAEAFSAQLRDGEDLLAAALPDNRPQRSAWLAATGISDPAASMLRDPLGFDLLVLDQELYNGLEGSIGGYHDPTLATEVALDGGASLPGVIVHAASRWLDGDAAASTDLSPIDRAIAVMAELRVARSELGAEMHRSAVLALPSGTTPDPTMLTALAGYATSTPGTTMVRLADVAPATDLMMLPTGAKEVVRLPATAGIDLAARVERINLTRLGAAGAGSMLVDQTRAEAWDAQLDELVSTAIDDATVDARLAIVNEEIAAVHRCIDMPEPFTFTLTGRSSPLRVNLTNTCDEDLRVVVHPTSSKLAFPNGDVAKTLVANDITEVTIDVQSRTNGTSAVGIELLTPAHSLRLPQPLVLTARVNALSGLGQVVTGGALLVLLSWWYGHFRRRRRARRAMLGEVDNPVQIPAMSPDAAEVVLNGSTPPGVTTPTDGLTTPTDSVSRP